MCLIQPNTASRVANRAGGRSRQQQQQQGHQGGQFGIASLQVSLEHDVQPQGATVPSNNDDSAGQQQPPAASNDPPMDFLAARTVGKRLQDEGNLAAALKVYRSALQQANKKLDAVPIGLQQAYADTLLDIGCILAAQHRPMPSVEALYACLDLRRRILSPTDVSIAIVLYELSLQSEPGCALELLLEAHAILNTQASTHSAALAQVWYSIGTVQQALGQLEAAASAFQEARSLEQRSSQ